jgi:hypothetical protein
MDLAALPGNRFEALKGKRKVSTVWCTTCKEVAPDPLRITREELDLTVTISPIYVGRAQGGDTDSVAWCNECFPKGDDGSRISWQDLERFTAS